MVVTILRYFEERVGKRVGQADALRGKNTSSKHLAIVENAVQF